MTKHTDILSFNSVDIANKGEKMPLTYQGKDTGINLHVLGSQADAVKDFQKEYLKDYARKSAMAEKKGKTIDFNVSLVEQMDTRSIDAALVRVTGWDGQEKPFDKETLKTALINNPQWIDDIVEFSDALGK